jgi:outer membrane receptor for ferric coprogen and ferric-rhodotorulic acid
MRNSSRLILAALILSSAGALQAEDAQPVRVAVSAQPIATAINELSRQSGLHIVIDSRAAEGVISTPVDGTLSAEAALTKLLENTGLEFEYLGENSVAVVKKGRPIAQHGEASKAARPGEDAVNQPFRLAQASAGQESAGSSDSGSTARDDVAEVVVRGNYAHKGAATVGGKTQQSLRYIPQSISVLTRQRLDDQNISSLPEALKYTTGVTVQRFDGAGIFNTFHARGYAADSYLIDGLNLRTDNNMVDLDLAIFDRIEVMRGPAGLFQGAGEPGITVSLARKRALGPTKVQTALSGGSWENYRGELDVTGALTESERVRGRAVAVLHDRDTHLEGIGSNKKLIYATTEFDVWENATLSLGGTYQDVRSVTDQGLPALVTGELLDLPRSTSISASWNLQDMQTAEVFADLENHFANGGLLRIAVRRQERDMFYRSARPAGVDVAGNATLQSTLNVRAKNDSVADVFYTTPFDLAGRKHNLLVGVDYRKGDADVRSGAALDQITNVYTHDRDAFPLPTFVDNFHTLTDVEEYGVYSQLRLRPMDRLQVMLGGRMSWWDSADRNVFVPDSATLEVEADGEFTPYAGLVFDLNDVLSLYASYADIYKAQAERTIEGEQIRPRVGAQYEAGLKGEFMDGQVNAHAAVFRLVDENRALADLANPGFFLPLGKVRSQGAEAEINGKLTPNLSVSAGYAYNDTKYLRAAPNLQGQTFSTFTPSHTGNVWMHYAFRGGSLQGLELGLGARAVSEFYNANAAGIRWVADSYTVVSSQVAYAFSERHKLALNVENVLDEKYYEKVFTNTRQNYYGAPLSFVLTLRSQF